MTASKPCLVPCEHICMWIPWDTVGIRTAISHRYMQDETAILHLRMESGGSGLNTALSGCNNTVETLMAGRRLSFCFLFPQRIVACPLDGRCGADHPLLPQPSPGSWLGSAWRWAGSGPGRAAGEE